VTNREGIYAALFAKFDGITGMPTKSRRLMHWADVLAVQQPALFQAQKSEIVVQSRGLPPKWQLDLDLYLYVHAGDDPGSVPTTVLNPLIDAIEAALAPDNVRDGQNVLTLGGLVSHCWISGQIQTDEGALGAQSIAIIPISILVP
jgi:hypothetical protein